MPLCVLARSGNWPFWGNNHSQYHPQYTYIVSWRYCWTHSNTIDTKWVADPWHHICLRENLSWRLKTVCVLHWLKKMPVRNEAMKLEVVVQQKGSECPQCLVWQEKCPKIHFVLAHSTPFMKCMCVLYEVLYCGTVDSSPSPNEGSPNCQCRPKPSEDELKVIGNWSSTPECARPAMMTKNKPS